MHYPSHRLSKFGHIEQETVQGSKYAYRRPLFSVDNKNTYLFISLLQKHDARIIVTASYEDKAKLVFCAVSKYRGYYMNAHVLFNLFNELRKRDKI